MLFLLEKLGPMTSPTGKRAGSGSISRNNDDQTAEKVFNFMRTAGIERNPSETALPRSVKPIFCASVSRRPTALERRR